MRGETEQDECVLELTDSIGVDLALDPVGGPMTQQLILATRQGGTVIVLGASARAATVIDAHRYAEQRGRVGRVVMVP